MSLVVYLGDMFKRWCHCCDGVLLCGIVLSDGCCGVVCCCSVIYVVLMMPFILIGGMLCRVVVYDGCCSVVCCCLESCLM